MPIIYLTHPLHGQKACSSVQEANYDKGNGWVEFDHTAPRVVEPPFTAVVEQEEPAKKPKKATAEVVPLFNPGT